MTVSMLIDRWLIRRQLQQLARNVIDSRLPDGLPEGGLPAALGEYAPQLPREVAYERFFDLIGAVLVRDRCLAIDGHAQVRTALDALTGGAA